MEEAVAVYEHLFTKERLMYARRRHPFRCTTKHTSNLTELSSKEHMQFEIEPKFTI